MRALSPGTFNQHQRGEDDVDGIDNKLVLGIMFAFMAGLGGYAIGSARATPPPTAPTAAQSCLLDVHQLEEVCDSRARKDVAAATETLRAEADVWKDQATRLLTSLSAEQSRRDESLRTVIAETKASCESAKVAAEAEPKRKKVTH